MYATQSISINTPLGKEDTSTHALAGEGSF